MTNKQNAPEITPDELMGQFRGRSLKSIVVFTLIVHAVVLVGTSIPFLLKSVVGTNTAGMSEEERVEHAVREATASLRKIAEEHGLNPQDLSGRFSGERKPLASAPEPATNEPTIHEAETGPEKPKSAIEQELDVKEQGPTLPSLEEEDLFK